MRLSGDGIWKIKCNYNNHSKSNHDDHYHDAHDRSLRLNHSRNEFHGGKLTLVVIF